MPSVKKLLSKFSREEREKLELFIEAINSLNWRNLDVKKLKGYQNIFRVRKGKIRIVFTKDKKDISILSIDRRHENIYKL